MGIATVVNSGLKMWELNDKAIRLTTGLQAAVGALAGARVVRRHHADFAESEVKRATLVHLFTLRCFHAIMLLKVVKDFPITNYLGATFL